jgi:hypothetical protein
MVREENVGLDNWILITVLMSQPRKTDYFETEKHLLLIGSDRFYRTSIAGNSKVFGLGALESVHGVAESKRTESCIQYFDRQEPAGKQNIYLLFCLPENLSRETFNTNISQQMHVRDELTL